MYTVGLFCGEVGLFYYGNLQAHLHMHSTYSYYHQENTGFTQTTHVCVYIYIYVNISLDEEFPGSMYLLPQVAWPTVVVGRGVDV